MARFIKAPLQTRKALKKQFGVTRVAVNDALSFRFNSRRAIAIREAALAAGGMVMEPALYPGCETKLEGNFLTHLFDNGVGVCVDLCTNVVSLYKYSTLVYYEEDVTVNRWLNVLNMAAAEAAIK